MGIADFFGPDYAQMIDLSNSVGGDYGGDPGYYNDTSVVDETPFSMNELRGISTGDMSWMGGPQQDTTYPLDLSIGNFGNWQDIGNGVYSDGSQYLLPDGSLYNGSEWSNLPGGGTGGTNWGQLGSNLLSKLMTPEGLMGGLKGLAGIAGLIQGAKGYNNAVSPVSAPQMTGSRAKGLSALSYGTPQARPWQSVISRAQGGPLKAVSQSGALNKRPSAGMLQGPGAGQQDDVPVMASHGEYVMDADTVSALGDGNTDAGAARLDKMRENIRTHKRSAPPSKIPPKAKAPEQYLKGGKR